MSMKRPLSFRNIEQKEKNMKKNIHPEYKDTIITCACGEVIHTRSTKQNIRVDICSKCHPFFTGKQKLVDSAGRVDRFKKRYADMNARKAKKGGGDETAKAPGNAANEEVHDKIERKDGAQEKSEDKG